MADLSQVGSLRSEGSPSSVRENFEDSPEQRIQQVVRRYFAVWWMYAFGFGFLFAVYPLFLRARGLNQLQINCMLTTYFIVTFLTDLPTGAFLMLSGGADLSCSAVLCGLWLVPFTSFPSVIRS